MRAAALLAATFLLVFLAASKVSARDPKPTRITGYGQIRFQGLGPEKWAQRYRQERALRRRLEERLEQRGRVRRLQATGAPTATVNYALRLAAAVTGVPLQHLRTVAYCESRHWPYARNGQYRGLFQEGPMFESSALGRAGFSVWDPVANALTAALTVAREGWSQWACKPDGSVR